MKRISLNKMTFLIRLLVLSLSLQSLMPPYAILVPQVRAEENESASSKTDDAALLKSFGSLKDFANSAEQPRDAEFDDPVMIEENEALEETWGSKKPINVWEFKGWSDVQIVKDSSING